MYLLLAGTPVPSSHKLVMVTYVARCLYPLAIVIMMLLLKEREQIIQYIFVQGATRLLLICGLKTRSNGKRSIHIVKLQGSKLLMIGRGELGHEKIYFYRQFCASQCQNINHSAHQQPRYFEF